MSVANSELVQVCLQSLGVLIAMAIFAITIVTVMIKVLIELRRDRNDRNQINKEVRKMWDLMEGLRLHINGERWLKEVRAKLTGKLQGALSFMPNDKDFQAYLNIAACGYIEYVLYILSLDPTDTNVDYLKLKFNDTERVIQNEGGHLLPEGLLGYLSICQAVDKDRFYADVMKILLDQENAKKYRICDVSEAFIANFLATMNKAWYNFQNTEIPNNNN